MQSQLPFVRFVTRKWSPAVGGMETYCLRLTEHLQKHCELEILALPGQTNGDAPTKGKLILFGLNTAVRLLTCRRAADVIHIADMASWPLGVAAQAFRRTGKVVLSAHGTDVSFAHRAGWINRLYRRYLDLGRRMLSDAVVIANSTATQDALHQLGFKNVHMVPLAATASESLAFKDPKPYVLFAGRLIKRKGLSWFAKDVLPLLSPEITLHVAGPIWDATEAACLENDRVRYLGTLETAPLSIAYREALGVIVSNLNMEIGHLKGFGLVAPEAAAAGAVVLAANTGGLTDAVLDGKTGFLLPPSDARAWADRITEILTWDSATRAAFLRRSQEMCHSHFSWDRVARDTAAFYVIAPDSKGNAS